MSDYPSGYVSLLSGWLQSGQVTTYNADGQVTAQAQFGRWGTNWTSLGLQDDMGTLPDETSSAPTISSDDALTRGGITTYTGFDHDDHAGPKILSIRWAGPKLLAGLAQSSCRFGSKIVAVTRR